MKKLLTKLLALLAAAISAPLFAASVSMTSPANGALYLAPATLPVKSNASAPGATVTQVEFFANGVSIGVDTTSPYQFDWSGVAAGTYAITAVVTDSNGNTATSAARTITVAGTNTAPTVSLSTPADNSRYLNPPSVTLSATASGPELNDIIQSVAFYLNGTLAQTVTSAPFSYDASGLAAGTYSLTAIATDSQGAQTTSAARTFTVSNTNTPPTVSLVIPQDNTNWKTPATVTFQASVSSGEANDTVSVEFFANGTSLGTRSSSPFSLSSSLSAGTYTITAVATDGQGAQTTSTARTINVSDTNLPPTVAITSPAANATFPNPPVASISITSTASGGEINDSVSKVEFYANGALIGTRSFGPFNFTWTNVAQGNYSLTAIAYDSANATTTSAPVSIKVGNPASLAFIEVDHLNTPRAVYDASQQLRWKWDQAEPFGVNTPNEDPSSLGAYELPLRFPGQYSDKETNLNYNYFREYDSALGRYTRSDPLGLGGGLNTYAYLAGTPLSNIDLYGLAGTTTHGLRKCLPSDPCPVLQEKIQKLIASLGERRSEMAAYGPQPYSSYAGHAMQIAQQMRMLRTCQAYYENHQPPCCGSGEKAPDYNPYPLPEWEPEPAVPDPAPAPAPTPTPPNQNSNAMGAVGTAVMVIMMLVFGRL